MFIYYLQNTPFRELSYSLLGDDQGPTFFSIEEETGIIRVKTDLRSDDEIQYQVGIIPAYHDCGIV